MVDGRPVEIVTGDHQMKVDMGSALPGEWFDHGGVQAILDVPNSAIGVAVHVRAREKGRIALLSGSVASDITGKLCSPNTVQVSLDTYAAAKAAVLSLVAEGGRTWCFITADVAFGHALQADATRAVTFAGGSRPCQTIAALLLKFAVLESLRPIHFTPVFEGVISRLRHLLCLVPAGVGLRLHLSDGDSGHKHFKEPDDATLMVRVATTLADSAGRRLDWIHMPVPRDRKDEAYCQPLRDLSLAPGYRLFLGVIHDEDGFDGARRRVPQRGVGLVFLGRAGYRGQAAKAGMLTVRSSLNGAMVSRVM